MYFLYSAQVVAATVRERPAGEGGLEQVGGIPGPGAAACTDQGMGLVDEQDDGLGRGLDLLDHLAEPVLELALHASPGLEEAHVQGSQADIFERGRHVPGGDAQREAFHHRGLADPGLAGEDGVVLATTHQNVDELADLLVASDDGVQLALAGALGQVHRELLERLLLAHLRRGHGIARLARGRAGAQVKAVVGRHAFLRGARADLGEALGQGVGLNLVELPRDAEQAAPKPLGLQDAHHQVSGAHLGLPEEQGGIGPGPFGRLFDVRGQIRDGAGAPGQPVEGLGEVSGKTGRVQAEAADNPMQVRVLALEDLVQPVHQLHIGIAAHLAEYRGALDRLIGERIELAEEGGAADLGHEWLPVVVEIRVECRPRLNGTGPA